MTEQQAIKGALKKDPKSQRFLYDSYKSRWYMICLRYMSNRYYANDALQNGMINVFSKISMFDADKGNFGSWTSRIIANDSIMLLRKRSKGFSNVELTDSNQIFDINESALDVLSRKELMDLIQKLPDGYRVVFNMYVIEGYAHKEIAEKLSITVGTSKSQLFKAKKMLKQALEVLI